MKAIIFTDMAGYHGFGRAAGAYRIASEFRQRGQEVKVIDCFNSYTLEQLKTIIKNYKTAETEWVGFSTTFLVDRENNFIIDRRTKTVVTRSNFSEKRDIQTSTALSQMDEWDLFNFIRGLGLRVVLGGWRQNPHLNEIEGVDIYRGPCEDKFFQDFDFTKSQIYYNEDDHIFEGEDLPIEVARGCIFKCTFCYYSLDNKKLWEFVKDPQVLREEMMRNYINFGTTGYMVSDDTYNDHPDKVKQLLDMYKTLPFDLRFSTYARLDLMLAHPETQEMMVESGLKSVIFGVETLNHDAGKFIRKGMDPEKVKQGLIDFARKYPEVIIQVNMIGGLPGESFESMKESHRFLTEEAKIYNVSWAPLFINSNSELSLNAEKHGYKKSDNNQRSWIREDGLTYMDVFDWIVEKKREAKGSGPASFTLYNRLHNVGYSHDELLKLTWENDADDMLDRTEKFREIYMKKIL